MKFSYYQTRDKGVIKSYKKCFDIFDKVIASESSCIQLMTSNFVYFKDKYSNTICLKNK